MFDNIMKQTDSYKVSHYRQYPKGSETVHSYLESRGGRFNSTVFFGLQYYMDRYLKGKVVTKKKIDAAEKFWDAHMGPGHFNRAGWEHILSEHGGRLPIEIRAVPEGTVVPTGNVLVTVHNTDPAVPWLVNYIETMLVKLWYPITVATQSREFKKMIAGELSATGGIEGLGFKLHDFGYRGVSSEETAALGGAAHLVNFLGTDNAAGLELCAEYYGEPMAGFSIPASEHSTITSWGRANELDAVRNMLTSYPTGLVACVSDSYNIYDLCRSMGTDLYDLIMQRDGTFVVRPDSGHPPEVVVRVLDILGEYFKPTINEQGYKVLPPQIRVIQGDGIDLDMVAEIYTEMEFNDWSAENVAFGSGGALLQKLDRDTQKFAFKASYIIGDGFERDVSKSPIDAPWKASKSGELGLFYDSDIGHEVVTRDRREDPDAHEITRAVFRDGKVLLKETFAQIRGRAQIHGRDSVETFDGATVSTTIVA